MNLYSVAGVGLHREDGPAVEWANGSQEWYLNGKRHRADGPAVVRIGGRNEWWFNGLELSKFEVWVLTGSKADT